ncbi:MAG: MFS transporter [Rhodocyclaceae bacterium]|nr:MAG: MFS transporter [Rhodocyclaceae bacterium]
MNVRLGDNRRLTPAPGTFMPDILRALRHRNYRLYFSGQLVSLAGTWMQMIAMSWLTYRLTDSTLMLGVVSFAGQIPILAVAPLGGVLSDRFDKRVMMLWTQSLALAQASILAILTLTGAVHPWHLVLMSLSLGLINAFDTPARQSFLVDLVDDRDDLPNAIALNSFTMNSARFLGPSIGGIVVGLAGEGICFLLNALSYLAVILALWAIRTRHHSRAHLPAGEAMRQGWRYAFGMPQIRQLLYLVAAASFYATPYVVLLPYFAREIYAGGAQTFGFMSASAGAGALLGTIYLAARKSVSGLDRVIGNAVLSAGLALAVFSLSDALVLAIPALAILGFSIICIIASSNTLIQSIVEDDMRGRVMALFTVAFLGIAPLGSLTAGGMSHQFGARATLLGCALALLAAGIAFIRLRQPYAVQGPGLTTSDGIE